MAEMTDLERRVLVLAALSLVFLIFGCAGSPYRVARMDASEIRGVTDHQLCRAWAGVGGFESSRTRVVVREIERRRVDCSNYPLTGTVTGYPAYPSAPPMSASHGDGVSPETTTIYRRQGGPYGDGWVSFEGGAADQLCGTCGYVGGP